ncbi:hypothetical protein AVEN_71830-1 [Araneus ventricosus]|uniref:Tc1-like transposase DDE domain-containing protein n=1 Tax=Araneus ventricosus TaxID=182803 RepID=A0A4Y2JAR4_ARAVE|nr:hypothetical protein AVEN_71830-1 [Araneus ventricosus]
MLQTFFRNGDVFSSKATKPVFTQLISSRTGFLHEIELSHLPWPPQSLDLNIIEPLWSTLERKVRDRYPPPSSLSELATVLQGE